MAGVASPSSAGATQSKQQSGGSLKMRGSHMRSPAPRANAGNRAEVSRNETFHIIAKTEPEADFAALFIARRYRLAAPVARVVAALAGLGHALT